MNRKTHWENAIWVGVLLSAFAFAFGPWLGSNSALWIVIDLGKFLAQPDALIDVSRQQAVYRLLLISGLLLLISLAIVSAYLAKSHDWMLVVQPALAIGQLAVLAKIYFDFDARTSGLLLMIAGTLLFLAGTIVHLVRDVGAPVPGRLTGLRRAAANWEPLIRQAHELSLPLLVMSARFDGPVTKLAAEEVRAALRGQDRVLPVRDGMLVLFWDTPVNSLHIVGHKLVESLTRLGAEHTALGVSEFPRSGQSAADLLVGAEADQQSEPTWLHGDANTRFHERAAAEFQRCHGAGYSYSLGLVGVQNYEEYALLYGDRLASEVIQRLTQFLDQTWPGVLRISFSVGVVMVALPERTAERARDGLVQIEKKMRAQSFVGALLEKDSGLVYRSAVGAFPQDGDQLSSLTEALLGRYYPQK
jgi:hypothetical protein